MKTESPSPRSRIYLDNNASTPVYESVIDVMLPYLRENYGNASSIHLSGQVARAAIEDARERLAASLDVRPAEVMFTSGITESINAAIRGALEVRPEHRRVVVSAVEHSATLDVCQHLAEKGYDVVYLPVDGHGRLDLDDVRRELTPETAILSLLWVNNETGVYFDIPAIAEVAAERGIPFHVDAAQIAGKGMATLKGKPIDLLSFGAHKFGGPKGVGALYVSRRARIRPLIWGGHHERGRRGGTENTAGIVGMAEAFAESERRWALRCAEVGALRDQLAAGIRAGVPDVLVNGAGARRLENTLNLCFRNIEGAALVLTLSGRGIYCSSGSACTASQPGPSHVLSAMKVPGDFVHGSVRLSLSSTTTEAEIQQVVPEIIAAYHHVSRVNLV